ncbi:MAG: NAD(+)/NADH kinase [Planctomycetota bacterium]|jgi:NAD+ kinase
MPLPRVVLLANRTRSEVIEVLEALHEGLADRVTFTAECEADGDPLPAGIEADLAIAVGGDGTIISQARRLLDTGLPLVGVNVGRLGFLAEFDVRELLGQADVIFGPSPPVREHLLLAVRVLDASGNVVHEDVAVNDCVVTAGPPFRMIELRLSIDGSEGPVLSGDGVIVATPVGSTAYNVSAGGPIVQRHVDAVAITPLAAHSLAFRPIVVGADSSIRIDMGQANEGTAVVLDGQISIPVEAGHAVHLTRHDKRARLVDNPATTYWRILLDKMRWAAPPTYRDRGS